MPWPYGTERRSDMFGGRFGPRKASRKGQATQRPPAPYFDNPIPKVVFSFTSSPSRIKKCRPMLESVLHQSVPADMILLNIPEVFARTGEHYEVPAWVRDRVTVNHCGEDCGPGMKIAPTVTFLRKQGWPETTLVVYGDDDIAYPRRLLETLPTDRVPGKFYGRRRLMAAEGMGGRGEAACSSPKKTNQPGMDGWMGSSNRVGYS